MIFGSKLYRLVLEGKKTQTRRPAKIYEPPARGYTVSKGRARGHQASQSVEFEGVRYRQQYIAGKTYAVQPGRGKKAKVRIWVLEAAIVPLLPIPFADVREEGFKTTEDFLTYWESMHGTRESVPVWRIRFELAGDEDRFMAAQHGKLHPEQYVHSPASAVPDDEPTPVVPAGYQARISGEARERDKQRNIEKWTDERETIAESIKRLKDDPVTKAACGPQLRAFERHLEVMDQRLRTAA